MARPGTKLALLTSCALIFAAPELTAQSGSVLSDLSNPEVQARYRAEAAKRIACPPIAGYDALMAAYAANATSKWDRAAMGCALEYGAEAMKELSLPKNLGWALAYNLSCIPLAVAGWIPAWLAGLGMAGSSLLVVGNALRLATGLDEREG